MQKIEGYQGFAINWIESERGMGQRDDGFSLHLSKEDAVKFKQEHGIEGSSEIYSFPYSEVFRVIINETTYQILQRLLQQQIFGQRYFVPRRLEPGEVVDVNSEY